MFSGTSDRRSITFPRYLMFTPLLWKNSVKLIESVGIPSNYFKSAIKAGIVVSSKYVANYSTCSSSFFNSCSLMSSVTLSLKTFVLNLNFGASFISLSNSLYCRICSYYLFSNICFFYSSVSSLPSSGLGSGSLSCSSFAVNSFMCS